MNLSTTYWSDIFRHRSSDTSRILSWLFNEFEDCVRDHLTGDSRWRECRLLGAMAESAQMLDEHTLGLEHSVCPTASFRTPSALFDLGTITIFTEHDLPLDDQQLQKGLHPRIAAVILGGDTDVLDVAARAHPVDVWSSRHGANVRVNVQFGRTADDPADEPDRSRPGKPALRRTAHGNESVVLSFTLVAKTVNKRPQCNNVVRFHSHVRDMYLRDMVARMSSISFKYRSYADSGLAKNQEQYYLPAYAKLPQNEWLRVLLMDNVSPAQYDVRELFFFLNGTLTERFATLRPVHINETSDVACSLTRPFYMYYAVSQPRGANLSKLRLDIGTLAPGFDHAAEPIECRIEKSSKHCAVLKPC